MGLRPAVITPLRLRIVTAVTAVTALTVVALGAAVAKPAATTLAKASPNDPGHKTVAQKAVAQKPGHLMDLDWKELLPEGERAHFTAVAPPPVHDYRGEGGPPAVQAQDFNVNKSLEGATVRLPGFIVPLEGVKDGSVSEFLLVPYFGSCIHVPPPPPNQIVYVHNGKRAGIESIY
jgi:uncharacterized protein